MCWGKEQREQIPLCVPEGREQGGGQLGRPWGHRVVGWQFRRSLGVWILMEGGESQLHGRLWSRRGCTCLGGLCRECPRGLRQTSALREWWQPLGRGHWVGRESDPEGPRTEHRSREPGRCEQGRDTT